MNQLEDAAKRLRWGIVFPLIGIAILWIVHSLQIALDTDWYNWGVFPRSAEGLRGIFTTPFLHGDYGHLGSNSTALFVLGFVMINLYTKSAVRVMLLIWLLGGLILWLIGRETYHIGASGVVYGMAAYLFVIGLLRWEPRSLAVSLVVVFLYGSMWWGLFPIAPGMSWEGHIGGAIAGTAAAFLFFNRDPLDRPEDRPDEETDLPYWMYEEEGELKKPRLPDNMDMT